MNERGRGCGGGTVDGVGSDGVGFGLSGWVEEEMEGRGEDREDRRVGKEVEESCVCRATRGRELRAKPAKTGVSMLGQS